MFVNGDMVKIINVKAYDPWYSRLGKVVGERKGTVVLYLVLFDEIPKGEKWSVETFPEGCLEKVA